MYAVDVDNHESALLSALVPARALAPRAQNLERLLGAVAPDAAHGLEILPSADRSPGRFSVARPAARVGARGSPAPTS